MKRELHAEWTKLRTMSGSGRLPLAAVLTVVLTVALSAAASAAVTCPAIGCDQDPVRLSLTGVHLGQAAVAMLAVLAIGGEYGTGMIRTTFTAMPRRAVALSAKAAVLAGGTLAVGTVAVLGSVLAGRLILPGGGFVPAHGFPPLSPADGPTLRAALGSVLYLVLVALLSLGVAAAVRDAAAAIGTVLGLLYVFPLVILMVSDPAWQLRLWQVSPLNAGLAIQSTTPLPLSPGAGLAVVAAWAAAALLTGGLLLRLRDA
ncbi:ABC transporter permease [Microtetraspora sp. NBRC 13810]|uniref:ABC transporter permease n=1 Tax=Microtetraspora sp. NBRC 13810 TaxID=3030990 RepID=UPI0024A53D7B|nr:ABC transporter permease [Microtetraspora sp. NBRC 13810]GLW06836.1 ABC transporter permease [Microtetraspora sp. NBRC 13810]